MMIDYMNYAKYTKVKDWASNNIPSEKISESLSPNQISSKLWLVEELAKVSRHTKLTIEIVGSWYGWPLIEMLHDRFDIDRVIMFDIDKSSCRIAIKYRDVFGYSPDKVWVLNENYWHWDRATARQPDIVINCSSEHMEETFSGFYPYSKDCIFAIQSNDMTHIEDHINCVEDEEDLILKHRIKKVLYKGSKSIIEWNGLQVAETPYNRYMVIGKI